MPATCSLRHSSMCATMEELTPLLIQLDYPNIKALSEEEIVKIFEIENRPQLLRWFVGELLADVSKTTSYNDTEIVDIIRNFGYCTSAQKEGLRTGTLDYAQQYEILHRMLHNLSIIKKPVTDVEQSPSRVTLEELNALVSKKIDLFPSLTEKQSTYSTDDVQTEWILSLQEQIKDLEEKLKQSEKVEKEEKTADSKMTETVIENEQENVDMAAAINKFMVSTSELTELQNNTEKNLDNPKFSEDFQDKLTEACEAATDLEQYFNNLSIIDDFNANEDPIEVKESPECFAAVDKLLKIAEEL